jgi:hypothetical protein
MMHQTSSQDFKHYGYANVEGERLNADIRDDFIRNKEVSGYNSLGGGAKNLNKPSSAAPSRKPIQNQLLMMRKRAGSNRQNAQLLKHSQTMTAPLGDDNTIANTRKSLMTPSSATQNLH